MTSRLIKAGDAKFGSLIKLGITLRKPAGAGSSVDNILLEGGDNMLQEDDVSVILLEG